MSSRGQRPLKCRPLTPFPRSPVAGRGVPEAGCGALVRGLHPRLLNLLPSGEHVVTCGRPLQLSPAVRSRLAAGCRIRTP